jgi:hypothetical protein
MPLSVRGESAAEPPDDEDTSDSNYSQPDHKLANADAESREAQQHGHEDPERQQAGDQVRKRPSIPHGEERTRGLHPALTFHPLMPRSVRAEPLAHAAERMAKTYPFLTRGLHGFLLGPE